MSTAPMLEIREAVRALYQQYPGGCNGAACHAQIYMMGTLLRRFSPSTCSTCREPIDGGGPLGCPAIHN